MKENKYKIECGFDELCLIERALELYGRVGMLQFNYLTLCNSLQKEIWTKKLNQEFQDKADDMKAIFGWSKNSNPGILNKDVVGDDCRQAIHMYEQLRHQRYLDRMKADPEEERKHYGVDSSPADVCILAGMKSPEFKIETNEQHS